MSSLQEIISEAKTEVEKNYNNLNRNEVFNSIDNYIKLLN
jgi:hypothetical protein